MSAVTLTKLSVKEKIGYGLGDTASNFVFHIVNAFLLFYYTNVFGLDPAAVGTLYAVARIWDAVTDPLMGSLADRTETRFGKYRPYLLWMAVPFGVLGFLAFLGPDFSDSGKLAFAYITYIALMAIYTAINVPYSALMGVITPDPEERTSLSTFRFWGAFSAQVIIGLTLFPLIGAIGGDDKIVGWRGAMAVFGVTAIILFLITFVTTRERVPPQKNQSRDIKADLKLLAKNQPLIVMLIVAVMTLAYSGIRWAITNHYLEKVANLNYETHWWYLDKISIFYTTGSLAFIAGLFLTKKVIALFGKRNALIGLMILNGIAIISFYFLPPENYPVIFWMNILAAFIAGPTPAIVWAIYTDVADYGEWKYGKRITALTFAAAMFTQKIGLAIGGAFAGWLLKYYGFVKDVVLTQSTKDGILLMFSVFPGVLTIITACVLFWYKITDDDVRRITLELEERRKEDL